MKRVVTDEDRERATVLLHQKLAERWHPAQGANRRQRRAQAAKKPQQRRK